MCSARALFTLALTLSNAPAVPALEPHRAGVGDSCRHAAQVEKNLGKRPTYDVEQMLQRGLLLFEGAGESGGNEQVLYRCSESDGTVVGYSSRLSSPSEAFAWSAYGRERAAMQGRFGAPAIDSEAFGLPKRIRFWRAYSPAFSIYEFCQWENASGKSISVGIQKLRDSAQWQVVTADMPPLASTVEKPRDWLWRMLARGLVVALSSAAMVAALAMTRLHAFVWLIALVVPLALAYETIWALPWNATSSPDSAGRDFFAVAIYFLLGAMASSLLIWRLGGRLASRDISTPRTSPEAKPILIFGVVLFVALLSWSWWQFRPGTDPGNLAGGFAIKLVFPPIVLLISTALTVFASMRLPNVVVPPSGSIFAPDLVFAVIGVLASVFQITLCVTIAAQIALAT